MPGPELSNEDFLFGSKIFIHCLAKHKSSMSHSGTVGSSQQKHTRLWKMFLSPGIEVRNPKQFGSGAKDDKNHWQKVRSQLLVLWSIYTWHEHVGNQYLYIPLRSYVLPCQIFMAILKVWDYFLGLKCVNKLIALSNVTSGKGIIDHFWRGLWYFCCHGHKVSRRDVRSELLHKCLCRIFIHI